MDFRHIRHRSGGKSDRRNRPTAWAPGEGLTPVPGHTSNTGIFRIIRFP